MLFDPVIDGGMGHACCCTESTRVTGGQCESTGRLLKKTHCSNVGDSMPRGTKDGGGGDTQAQARAQAQAQAPTCTVGTRQPVS